MSTQHNSWANRLKILGFTSLSFILISCSSDSDSDSSPPTDEQLSWTQGVFEAEGTFKNFCEVPRTDTDIDGDPWPDKVGSTLHENHWLRSWSNNTYLWYDEIQDQNPANFNDPIDYFAELKTTALTPSGNPKDRFHYTYDTDVYEQLVSSGASAGYGAEWVLLQSAPPRDVRVAFTEPNSPATTANLTRGVKILEVDGVDMVNGSDVDTLNAGLFPDSAGESHEFLIEESGGATRTVTMTSAIVTTDPVQNEAIINTGSGDVGYLTFNTFGIVDAESELIDAFETFEAQGISDLIIDLRYNGGGFLAISSQLAYMVAGSGATSGRTYSQTVFNDKHPTINPVTGQLLSPTPFYSTSLGFSVNEGQALPQLNLSRIFVLSDGGTCSASEAFINGLRGIDVEVILIGDDTCGKPYGFYATDNCGTTYFTIQFRGENDKAFGDYADGFVIGGSDNGEDVVRGCVVADDFDHLLGDEQEARLAAALNYRETGSCPAVVTKSLHQAPYKPSDVYDENSLYNSQILRDRMFLKQNLILTEPK
ncbi:MAG: S41 family peptidase [Kangiella sp.]|jgi:carboxyl-terminal processing protease|nr:S41 family peptidase [Kangiella sp.]MCW9028461.1 S41 family peptidase [Kangiella sp.]